MSRVGVWWLVAVLLALVSVPVLTTRAVPQIIRPGSPMPVPVPARTTTPRLEAVAETHLLMEGLAQANFRGLEKMLAKKPTDAEGWTFARGQALLLAETGNLLMLRPPKNQGQDAWMERARDLREAATSLARNVADRNYDRSVENMDRVASACNQCHRTFRVNTRVVPFADSTRRTSVSKP
jgi:hypothetical protein